MIHEIECHAVNYAEEHRWPFWKDDSVEGWWGIGIQPTQAEAYNLWNPVDLWIGIYRWIKFRGFKR